MNDFGDQVEVVRKYLLNLIDKDESAEIAERILSEDEFFEFVSAIESEMLNDYHAGRLSDEENRRVAKRYQSSETGREELNLAGMIYELARRNSASIEDPLPAPPSKQRPMAMAAGTKGGSFTDSASNFFSSLKPAYIVAGLFLVAGGLLAVWMFSPDKRASIEADLASLNSRDIEGVKREFGERYFEIGLQPTTRAIGRESAKIETVDSSKIVRIRLELLADRAPRYNAEFFDSDGSELFFVSDLRARKESGELFVPVLIRLSHFSPGDFKVRLRGTAADGSVIEVATFNFRIPGKLKS